MVGTIREAGKYVKPDANKPEIHISDVCRGKRQTAYGYKWRNKKDYRGHSIS